MAKSTKGTNKEVLVDMVEAGRKGGEARAAALSAKARSDIARKGAAARWSKKARAAKG